MKFLLPITFLLLLTACENKLSDIHSLTDKRVMVEEGINIETLLSQGSRMKAKMWSPYMLRYQEDTVYVEFPRSLHVNFFDSTGKVESHLDALYGKYYETLNRVFLRDSVLVYNMQGDTLRCPELWWDQSTQQLYTDKPVQIRKSGHKIYGVAMVAKQDLSDVNIKEVTNSILDVPDSLAAGL